MPPRRTPGFIDIHTHFDAQVFWDSALSPSPLHGVTTAIAGNCGFTIAPLSDDPADVDYLQRMLARVEGMPLDTLKAGVPWNWTSTAEYFERVERAGIGINLGFMVGHSAIRRVVMGPEATRRESMPDEPPPCRTCADELEAGGLSRRRTPARTTTPRATWSGAPDDELVELAREVESRDGPGRSSRSRVPPFHQWAVDPGPTCRWRSAAVNWNAMLVSGHSARLPRQARGR